MEMLFDLAMTFWQWTIVICLIIVGFIINSFDKKEEKRIGFTYMDMPKMQPVPILTKGKGFWKGIWMWITGVRHWVVCENFHYTLNGEKMWVTNGTTADLFVLFAKVTDHPDYGKKSHGGVTCFIIEKGFEGFEIGKKEDKLGIRSSDTCTLILNECKVPKANVLGEVGKGFPIAMNALDNSRIGIAAQGLGIAQGAYEAALKYSKERETFGKPIAAHQSISNYLADMAVRIDAARLQVYKAAWAKQEHYENGSSRHTLEASIAKLSAGDTAMWVSERAIQVLGGYGYTKDFPVERFFRDAKITQIYEGTQEVQRLVIAREIGK